MKNYTIRPYKPEDFAKWNAFIGSAKNATFLFHRDFMEYHSDRFEDYSLVVLDEEKWIAALPANRVGNAVFSHQGLTYGGLVFNGKMKLPVAIAVFKSVLLFLEREKVLTLQIKLMPAIYFSRPADELAYALFLANAKLTRRDSLSVLDLTKPFSFSKGRTKCTRRGEKNGLIIKEENVFNLFWNDILIPNLKKKHDAKPVHSLSEIEKLQQLFPENIRQFNVYHNDKLVAGTTIFVTENVVHPQYISGEELKNELGSLDYLYRYLIDVAFAEKHFFDFGISNEMQGRKLNEGIVFWKESFGATTLVQDFYEVETANYKLLENVLV